MDRLGILGPAAAGPLDVLSPPAPAPAASAAAAMIMMNTAAFPPPLPQPSLGMDVSAISTTPASLPPVTLVEQLPTVAPRQFGNLLNQAMMENQSLLRSQQQPETGPRIKIDRPLFSQLGLGVSRCTAFTADATESAVLAVQDALGKVALPPLDCLGYSGDEFARGSRRLLAQIKLGVPADGGTAPQRPMHVDHTAVVQQAAPYNVDTLPVQVVLGGLVVEDDAGCHHGGIGAGSGMCIAVASVTIVIATVEEELPRKDLVANALQMEPSRSHPVIESHCATQETRALTGDQTKPFAAPVENSAKENDTKHRKRSVGKTGKPEVTVPLSRDNSNKRRKNSVQPVEPKGRQLENGKKEKRSYSLQTRSKSSLKEEKEEGQKAKKDGSLKKPATTRSPSKVTVGDTPASNGPSGSHNFSIHSHPSYTDHAAERPTPAEFAQFEDLSLSYKTPPFPMRLHRLLEEVSRCSDRSTIVGWLAHGRAFRVLDVDRFVQTILPEYFRLTKYCSFLRQLNLYGFRRIGTGPDRSAYYSEWFLRGRPVLTSRMRRVRVNGNGRRIASDPDTEPDFYSMPPVKDLEGCSAGAGAPSAESAAGAESEMVVSSDGDVVSDREMTLMVQKKCSKPVGSIVSSEDTVSEDDAGGGLLALRERV